MPPQSGYGNFERSMSLRSKLSVAFAAVLVGLLSVFASSAAAKSGAKQGGTLRVDLFTDVDYTDPALDYLSTGWEIEYSTCLKLMNYPDVNGPKGSQLTPEAATGFPKISNGGKTYDFTVNVPLNNQLNAAGAPDRIADLAAVRERFEATWVRWNVVRTVASTAAFGCLTWALVLHGRVWPEP